MSDTEYKVRARGKYDFREFDTVRMEISVGQPYHEGEKLKAAMGWARDHFQRAVIILGDSPQRYNLMFKDGISEAEAEAQARKAGDEWLGRNSDELHGIEITRWNDWKGPDYLINRAMVSRLYTDHEAFRNSIQGEIEAFTTRRGISGEDKVRFFKNSEQYLLEETAVFATAYEALKGISAYPGGFLEMWDQFVDQVGPTIPRGLNYSHSTRLAFEKIPAGSTLRMQMA